MGKAKKNKPKRQFSQTGIPVCIDQDIEDEISLDVTIDGSASTIANVLENLQSTNADERECGCALLGSLVAQPAFIQQLLNQQVVKLVGPLMVDPSLSVRQNAIGALRNLSVEGGCEACVEMVRQDVMTPLLTLLQQYGTNWRTGDAKKSENLKQEAFLQAVHLLWNICESSEVAVGIFTRQYTVTVLLPCLRPDLYGYEMAVTVAQCLYMLTEENAPLVAQMASGELTALLEQLITSYDSSTEQLLLRTLATGILYNMNTGSLGTSSGELLVTVVKVLTMVLDQDATAKMSATAQLIIQEKNTPSSEENGPDIVDPTSIKNDALDANVADVLKLLSAQSIALEMTANLCCPEDEEGEDDWEDLDSDGNSVEDGAPSGQDNMDEAAASGTLPHLCVPSEVHSAFVSNNIIPKVLNKTCLPEASICDALNAHKKGMRVVNGWRDVQSRALLCLANLVGAMETSSLGGVEQLTVMWVTLSQLSTSPTVLKDVGLLDAVTSAMRAVAQKVSDCGSNKFSEVTPQDLQFLFEMGVQCELDTVRANAVRIVSIIGCCLAVPVTPHPLLKDIGLFLLETASKDVQLWVVAEALDAVFDVFAEDHLNPLMREIGLIEKLQELVPYLKHKIKSDRKRMGDHLAIVSTARTNLVRFIKYKRTH